MRSHSKVFPTVPHAHSSTIREFDYAPIPSKISSPQPHHTYSTSKTSTTMFHYAPLSSTTSSSNSLCHTPSSPPSSKAVLSQSSPSVHTSQPSSSISKYSLTTASTTLASAQISAHVESLPSGPSVGLTVAVAILLGILMTIAVAIWLVEVRGQNHPKKANHKERSAFVDQPGNLQGSMGLGISLHSIVKEEAEHEEICLDWFEGMMEKMIDLAVSRSRTELESDAEEKLLLPIQKDDRVINKRNQVDIELEAIQEC